MKITELRNVTIGVEHQVAAGNGTIELWRLTFTDKITGDVIFCNFEEPVRDVLVQHLTGGGVIVPRMAIPPSRPPK